jgi:hypothetical protein
MFYIKKNIFSIKKLEKCSELRRKGMVGYILLGYSIRVRIFKIDII